ncbi:MAG: TIGR02147 family protein [Bacteriovoracia bacterium]
MQIKKISEYQDYREFLREWFAYSRARNRKFSVRAVSRLAGFKSTSHLYLVINGKRNLSEAGATQVGEALRLSQSDQDIFRALVRKSNARDDVEKNQAHDQLEAVKKRDVFEKIEEAKLKFFTHWYYVPIRELIGLDGAAKDPLSISQALNPSVPAHEVKAALKNLEDLNLIKKGPTGEYERTHQFLTTAEQVPSAFVVHFHREMIRLASEAIERVPRQERDISSVSLTLSKDGVDRMQEAVKRFRRELAEISSQDAAEAADRVYQVNIQLFPLTGKVYRNKKKVAA